jgi:dUTP pyrophosphatase
MESRDEISKITEYSFMNAGKFVINSFYSVINFFTTFKVRLVHPDAKVPQKSLSAGYDVFSIEEFKILPGQRIFVSTGFSSEISKDFYIQVTPINYLTIQGIDIGNHIIDSTYNDVVKILLINNSASSFFVQKGMKIARFVLQRYRDVRIDIIDHLSETERGYSKFSSAKVT